MRLWKEMRNSAWCQVGQPILAAAGFQPARAGCEDLRPTGKSRLIGGCSQNWLPHTNGGIVLLAALLLACALPAFGAGKSPAVDPVVIFATYIGGSGNDTVRAVATDAAGDVYVAGYAYSADFPGTPPNNLLAFPRGFVLRLNPEGTRLIYSTVFGGNLGSGTSALALAVDSAGNAYVAGDTLSPDFPV